MDPRVNDNEAKTSARKADEKGRSMGEAARTIADDGSGRPERLRRAVEKVRTEDAELLDRLSR